MTVRKNREDGRIAGIEGMRALACLGIILMHIKANTDFGMNDFFYTRVVDSLTWLVFLFIMISGFGMCAGYLRRFNDGNVDLEKFYLRRYKKILPFFAVLLALTLIIDFSLHNLFEASMEATLLFGFLPNNSFDVVGVAWTVGVIFVFYFCFPAFTVLMRNKKRAWLALIISLLICFMCDNYFFDGNFVTESFTPRHNFLYCLPIFVVGGLIYLYLDNLKRLLINKKLLYLLIIALGCIVFYLLPDWLFGFNILYYKALVVSAILLIFSITFHSKLLENRFMQFLGQISMEMYLAQMVAFRIVEKTGIGLIFGDSYMSLIVMFILTVALLVMLILFWRIVYGIISRKVELYGKAKR